MRWSFLFLSLLTGCVWSLPHKPNHVFHFAPDGDCARNPPQRTVTSQSLHIKPTRGITTCWAVACSTRPPALAGPHAGGNWDLLGVLVCRQAAPED